MTSQREYFHHHCVSRSCAKCQAINPEHNNMAPQYHSINPVPASSTTSADALSRLKYLLASSIIASTLLAVAFSSTNPQSPLLSTRDIVTPHTGDFCANAEDYTKVTLKSLVDKPVGGLFVSKDLAGQRKFETSDVILKDGYFYSVCDSSWSLFKVHQDLPTLSDASTLLGSPLRDGDSESGLEAIFEDKATGDVYVVQEAVKLRTTASSTTTTKSASLAASSSSSSSSTGSSSSSSNSSLPPNPPTSNLPVRHRQRRLSSPNPNPNPSDDDDDSALPTSTSWHAMVLKLDVSADNYAIVDECPSEFTFEGSSKGFEGAFSVRGADGNLYVLGLCEGNYCAEGSKGREAGNGRVVVMQRVDDDSSSGGVMPGYSCYWKTVAVLKLPPSVMFVDYSSVSLHPPTGKVAISSQENSQVWVGNLIGGRDNTFDITTAAFSDEGAKLYDFPRNENCKLQYCNVEGLAWVDGGDQGGNGAAAAGEEEARVPQMLAAVSDKMKSKGKQAYSCFEKDQSFHLFGIP